MSPSRSLFFALLQSLAVSKAGDHPSDFYFNSSTSPTQEVVAKYRLAVQNRFNTQTGSWMRHAGLLHRDYSRISDTEEKTPKQLLRKTHTSNNNSQETQTTPLDDNIESMVWDHENDIQGYFDHLIEACDKDIIIEGAEGGEVSQQAFYKTCFDYLHDLIETPRCTTSFDSRTECTGEKTTKTKTISIDRILGESYLSQDTVNVVIIGAGPVGLFLASALTEYQRRIQNSAKHKVRVVVFESRLVRAGQKKLYSRDWMTDISLNYMDGTLNPRIMGILNGLFDTEDSYRRISLPINALETLMLLSTRLDGAKFVFDDYHNYSYQLQSIPNLVVFDATGHRLSNLNRDGKPDLSSWRPVSYNDGLEISYSLTGTFVEEMQKSVDGLYIASLQTSQGTVSYPTYGQDKKSGQPYNIYFLKLKLTTPFWQISAQYDPYKTRDGQRAPPICRYKDVVQEEETRFWCGPHFSYDFSDRYREDIAYCMYYLRQDPGFNFRLALMNLTPEQFQTLEEVYSKCQQNYPGSFEMPLECLEKAKLSENPHFGQFKVAEILQEINRVYNQYKEKMNGVITIAEPSWTTFVYRPYMYQDPLVPGGMISHLQLDPLMSEHNAPVLRAGDSLLSGDPNASTGLGTNMRIIRHFQCLLLDLPAEECELHPDPSSRTEESHKAGIDDSEGDGAPEDTEAPGGYESPDYEDTSEDDQEEESYDSAKYEFVNEYADVAES